MLHPSARQPPLAMDDNSGPGGHRANQTSELELVMPGIKLTFKIS